MTTRSILTMVILTCVPAAIVQPQEPRYLAWQPGKRIADRLSREDRHVVVDKHVPPLMGRIPGDLSPKEILEGSTLHAEAVLVVKLMHSRSTLTAARDWVVTRLDGQIVEQLKPHVLTMQLPPVVLELEGGVVKIGATTVEARAYWEAQLHTGKSYLVFCSTRTSPVRSFRAYEIGTDGRLHNTDPDFDPQVHIVDNLDGVAWAEARKIILAAPPRGRVTGMLE